jgi:N-acyl-D-aspartate/D-glutamate deacylase
MADIVIRNGLIVDGTGAPAYIGDVAVKDGKILAVGLNLKVKGAREVDATRKHVVPGWVDPHTHYDAQVMWDPMVSPSAANGVTTVVMGNCAVGIAPCPKPLRKFVTDLADAIEDIPAEAIGAVKDFWQWETFPEYMAVMELRQFACDVGVLVGHSAVRTWVLGARANAADIPGGQESNPLSVEEIGKMRKVVEEAVASGAVGLSSSRVSIHRDVSGVLLPGSLATHDELLEMGRGMSDGGGGVFELASTWNLYDDFVREGEPDVAMVKAYYRKEWEWVQRMSSLPGVSFTTGGGNGMTKERAWSHRHMLKQMDRVNEHGGDMMITPMMRLGTLFMGIHSDGLNPLMASPTFMALRREHGDKVSPAMLSKLQSNTAVKSAIVGELESVPTDESNGYKSTPGAYGYIGYQSLRQWVWPWSPNPENQREDSLLFAPEREGKTMCEYVYDIMTHPEHPHGGVLVRPLYNYGAHSFDPLREMFLHERVVAGFADGGAHGKGQCEATTPTTMVTFWCRDRVHGEGLPIELVVKKQTKDSADMMGLTDRGELVPGKRADINIFDLQTLEVLAPEYVYDFPLGSGRWIQDVRGYDMTICSGVPTFENDQPTGALPGRLAKNPRRTGRIANGLRGSVEAGSSEGLHGAFDLSEHAKKLQAKGMGASAIMKTVGNANAEQQAKQRVQSRI